MTADNDKRQKLGIYVHIPFCVQRCPYCGFYSNAGRSPAEIHDYFGLLKNELGIKKALMEHGYTVDSVYFGGGTPSLADTDDIAGLIDEIRGSFSLADDAEISLEYNPGTLSGSKLAALRAACVDRLSIGAQSFDDEILGTLGRIHSKEDTIRAFYDAREAGFSNINLDLMFAVPGMSMASWESTLASTLELGPEHVSYYSLQIEEGTEFYNDYRSGKLDVIPDGIDREMYHRTLDMLEAGGYGQYEISNSSLPGFECRHNLKYWTFADYLGIGASASSFIGGVRTTNAFDEYFRLMTGAPDDIHHEDGEELEKFVMGLSSEHHRNSGFDDMSEYVFTALRLKKGVDLGDFRERFGMGLYEAFPEAKEELGSFIDGGYIKEDAGKLRLTREGFDISNKIMSLFV